MPGDLDGFNRIDVEWHHVPLRRLGPRHWKIAPHHSLDEPWALYAHFDATYGDVVHYFGQASARAIDRQLARDKDGLYEFFEMNKLRPHLHVGLVAIHEARRMSKKLLGDVEALVIYRLRKDITYNTSNKATRGSVFRSGMIVRMYGSWPPTNGFSRRPLS